MINTLNPLQLKNWLKPAEWWRMHNNPPPKSTNISQSQQLLNNKRQPIHKSLNLLPHCQSPSVPPPHLRSPLQAQPQHLPHPLSALPSSNNSPNQQLKWAVVASHPCPVPSHIHPVAIFIQPHPCQQLPLRPQASLTHPPSIPTVDIFHRNSQVWHQFLGIERRRALRRHHRNYRPSFTTHPVHRRRRMWPSMAMCQFQLSKNGYPKAVSCSIQLWWPAPNMRHCPVDRLRGVPEHPQQSQPLQWQMAM